MPKQILNAVPERLRETTTTPTTPRTYHASEAAVVVGKLVMVVEAAQKLRLALEGEGELLRDAWFYPEFRALAAALDALEGK